MCFELTESIGGSRTRLDSMDRYLYLSPHGTRGLYTAVVLPKTHRFYFFRYLTQEVTNLRTK